MLKLQDFGYILFSDKSFHSYMLQILTWQSRRKGQLFIFLLTNNSAV